MQNLQRRKNSETTDVKILSNELFVNLVKYGKVVQSLYNKQLKQKYASLYRQFIALQKQLNETIEEKNK